MNRPASIESQGEGLALDDLLAAYLEEAESGQLPDRSGWMARHPEWAEELAAFFANLDHLGRFTSGLLEGPASPGDRIGEGGRYELIREIGRGGMGVVYEARDLYQGWDLALKMMVRGSHASAEDHRRFGLEAQAMASLLHPNIVPIFDIGEHDGTPYLAMKRVEGGSLARYSSRPDASPTQAARLMAVVAFAVDFAHQRGILHRDLKPSNILLDRDATPFVADFGLARWDDSGVASTLSGAILGTPAYMAPEQAEGRREAVTTSADVYGLGAILYELLTGRPPFRGDSPIVVLPQVLEREPDRPRSIDPSIPRDLETICRKCLEKEPKLRYASAKAVGDDLNRWLEGKPIVARRPSIASLAWKGARRRPTVAALVLACLVASLSASLAVMGLRSAGHWKAEVARRERDRQLAEFAAHASKIAEAERAWLANDVDRAWSILELCPEPSRRWEWHYLRRLCRGEIRTIRGHNGVSCGVAFAPELSVFACPNDRGGLTIWDSTTDLEVTHLRGHDGTSFGITFNPKGTLLATAGSDGLVRVWDVAQSRLVRTLPSHGEWAAAIAFSPDGERIASGGADRVLRVSDTSTGREILALQGHSGGVLGVAFSPDGKRLASASADGSILIRDAATGREERRLAGHPEAARCVAYSPDGTRLASGGADGLVRIWDVADGREILSFRAASARVDGLAYRPDGQQIATGGLDRSVRVWDPANGRELASFRGHGAPVFSVSYSADGLRLASASQDAVVKLWDPTRPTEARPLRLASVERWVGVGFGGDARVFGGGSDGEVAWWDGSTGRVIGTIEGSPGLASMAVSPTSGLVATLDHLGSLRVVEASTGREVRAIRAPDEGFSCVAFLPGGRRLVTGGGDPVEVRQGPRGKGLAPAKGGRSLKVWDVATGQEILSIPGHEGSICGVAASSDGRVIASSGADGSVRVWELATGREIRRFLGHRGPALALAMAPDDRRLASSGADGTVRLWDLETGQANFAVAAHEGWARGVAFHPDGSRLASGGADGLVKLLDATDGRELLALRQHEGRVNALAFRPDGLTLASASDDGTVRVWDASPMPSNLPLESRRPSEDFHHRVH